MGLSREERAEHARESARRWHGLNPDYSRLHWQWRRYAALQVIQAGGWDFATGDEEPVCSGCGCDDLQLLEANHKSGGGAAEWRGRPGSTLLARVYVGSRGVDDLDLRCRLCNAADYLKREYPGKKLPRVVWG